MGRYRGAGRARLSRLANAFRDRDQLVESIDRVLEWIDPDLAEMHTGHGPSVTSEPYGHVELSAQMARQT